MVFMLPIKVVSPQNSTVVKANELIQQSRFSLSLQQQKIILFLISQISPADEDFKVYEFSILEFCRMVNIEVGGNSYSLIKKAIKDIADKSIWLELVPGKEFLVRWIEEPSIDKTTNRIQLRLNKAMKPYLLQLKRNFTQYELIWTLRFRSKYSIRLYELIKSIHYHELELYTQEFSLEQLKKSLDAESYTEFKAFHNRALKPAVREINQYSDKAVAYELIKRGRSVVGIKFTISTKPVTERLQIRDQIEKDLGTNQISLWDELRNKGMV